MGTQSHRGCQAQAWGASHRPQGLGQGVLAKQNSSLLCIRNSLPTDLPHHLLTKWQLPVEWEVAPMEGKGGRLGGSQLCWPGVLQGIPGVRDEIGQEQGSSDSVEGIPFVFWQLWEEARGPSGGQRRDGWLRYRVKFLNEFLEGDTVSFVAMTQHCQSLVIV